MENSMLRMAALAGLLAVAPAVGEAAGPPQKRMEMLWSQADGLHQEIYASSRKEGAWSEPVKITKGDADKLHPVLETAPDGSALAFWSAVSTDGIAIEYAEEKNGKWSEPKKMELNQSTALTPSTLIDNSVVWLVWAGNNGGDEQDEIWCRRRVNGVWDEAKTVHSANDVPDIKPEISRNSQGQIEVRWLGFRDGAYKHLSSTYAEDGWSAEQEVVGQVEDSNDEEDALKEEVKAQLPAFLPQDSQYSLKVF